MKKITVFVAMFMVLLSSITSQSLSKDPDILPIITVRVHVSEEKDLLAYKKALEFYLSNHGFKLSRDGVLEGMYCIWIKDYQKIEKDNGIYTIKFVIKIALMTSYSEAESKAQESVSFDFTKDRSPVNFSEDNTTREIEKIIGDKDKFKAFETKIATKFTGDAAIRFYNMMPEK